jgi:hypothetical protein
MEMAGKCQNDDLADHDETTLVNSVMQPDKSSRQRLINYRSPIFSLFSVMVAINFQVDGVEHDVKP